MQILALSSRYEFMKTTVLLLIATVTSSAALDVIVPGANGNADTITPFTPNDVRYQQVYSATAFSSLQPVGGVITGLWFKVASGSPFANGLFQINLSSTARPVDGLSSFFADNVGGDDQVVFERGPYSMIAGNGPLGSGSFLVPLTNPFYYDPNAGNLLMDVRVSVGYGPGLGQTPITYSAFTDIGDSTSHVRALGLNSLSGTANSSGLATAFGITTVPEPGTVALILIALLTFSIFGLRKNQPNRKE